MLDGEVYVLESAASTPRGEVVWVPETILHHADTDDEAQQSAMRYLLIEELKDAYGKRWFGDTGHLDMSNFRVRRYKLIPMEEEEPLPVAIQEEYDRYLEEGD